jgi:phosphotransferase system  glucose/maltose/N-acetylglucosamine-specific IIC component
MLDRLFMSKLNKTGKILYFVGQVVLLGLIALIMFGALGVDFDEGYIIFIIAAVVSIIAWGGLCILIWPAQKKTENDKQTQPESGN